jgi:release factor glutamine methyltransferase
MDKLITFSIKSALQTGAEFLSATSPTPDLDARYLLQAVLQCSNTYLSTWPEQQLTASQTQHWQQMLARRAQGEPVAYLLGHTEFWSLPLAVTEATLIPRPDTECLVEAVLATLGDQQNLSLCELGTGSGAIALALASSCPSWKITAVDISAPALAVARANADNLSITSIHWQLSDWFKNISPQKFTAIMSNPPYLSDTDPHLNAPSLQYEPRSALVAGKTGLEILQSLIENSPEYLVPNGFVFLEHGFDQGAEVAEFFRQAHYTNINAVCDLAGHTRVTYAQYYGVKTL